MSAHTTLSLGGLFIAYQASFLFICAGDSTGADLRVMPRPVLIFSSVNHLYIYAWFLILFHVTDESDQLIC